MLKIYSDRGEVSTAPSRLGLGVSITQDLSSVPMLIALPLMALGQEPMDSAGFPSALLKGAAILIATGIAARWFVSPLLARMIRSRNRELILFFLMLVCLGASWATYAAGLSAALGAFVAGLTLAGSHYSHQVKAEVSPLRDLLVSLFFISVGMLLNTASLVDYAHIYIPALIIVLPLKFFSAFIPVLRAGYPLRIAVLTGTNIAQIGEFSFVLALVALGLGLISDVDYQIFIITGIISMLFNPFVIAAGPKLSEWFHRLPFSRETVEGRFVAEEPAEDLDHLEGHVIIAGYGVNGRNITRSLSALSIPHAALELSPETVAEAQEAGEPVYYGDCTRPDILRRLRIDRARVFVVAISDAQATRRAVQVARSECPSVHIIVRTRYLLEIDHLLSIGANEVIPEEFETSLEILARTLHEYQVPRRTIDQAITNLRSSEYQVLRNNSPSPVRNQILRDLSLDLELETTRIEPQFTAIGKTLQDLALPSRTGVVVLAVRKGSEVKTPPSASYTVEEGDKLIMVGTHSQLINALDVLEGREVA